MKTIIKGEEVELNWVDKQGDYGGHYEYKGEPFDGHRVLWGFAYEPETYLKQSDLSGNEWRQGGNVTITRNGVSVYKEFCRTPERALDLVHEKLVYLQDFSWEYMVVGRKLYNRDIPSIIDSVIGNGEIIVRTESGEDYPKWAHEMEDEQWESDWADKDKVHVLSQRLYWHRK